MSVEHMNHAELKAERSKVRRGLPPCLTELGIKVLEFAPEVTYRQQQEALIVLSNLSLRKAETDCF